MYPDATPDMKKALYSAKIKYIELNYAKGLEMASQDMFKQAYDFIISAQTEQKSLPEDQKNLIRVPRVELSKYYDNMFFHGRKSFENGTYGMAYLYLRMLSDMAPAYQSLNSVRKDLEDRILSRALKSIAVIPFKSPVSEPELGLQASANIMQLLQKQLTNDVKIIERGALEVLLREYELAVAGSVAGSTGDADSFKIKSADFLLMGDVLDSRTETNIQKSKRKDRVQVGTDKAVSIEWIDWEKTKERAEKERKTIPEEPKKYIDKPVYDYAEYDVAFYEKFSYLSISYRVVETAQGRVVYSNTVQTQEEAKDEATSGIDMGSYKVPMKVAKLPTDIELSNQVRKENIDKITAQIIELFKDQDVKYIAEAEKLESTGNLKEAVDMYVNGIVLMKKKKKDSAALEDKAGKYLDVLAAN
jgi:curli biogenesis system outer membrane secretion channel CsgG